MTLSKRQWIIRIATALRESYGNTLVEGGSDLSLAADVVRSIKKEIKFHSEETVLKRDFLDWREEFLWDANVQPKELCESMALEDWDRIKDLKF
jgi:hypothetical protein